MRTARETTTYRRLMQKKRRCLLELQRLKIAERRGDAHRKWLLGNLVVLAGLLDVDQAELDQYLERVAEETDILLRARWRHAGGWFFRKRKIRNAQKSGSSAGSKAAAHQRITFGGLFVKHGLEVTDRVELMGALLAMRGDPNTDNQKLKIAASR